MAGADSNYNRGDMEITEQKGTFGGFMGLTVYGGALIALMLLFPILTVGGVHLGWLPALIITFVVGVIIGVALKLKGTWFATITILAILTAIVCALTSLIAGML